MAVAKKTKKPKKLTNREKVERAALRKELKQEGILPPDKPRLNRTKFAAEVVTEFNEAMISIGDYQYVLQALACMVGTKMKRVTSEEVGVLKVLKIAIELKKFHKAKAAEGKTTYTVGELHDTVIRPILKL